MARFYKVPDGYGRRRTDTAEREFTLIDDNRRAGVRLTHTETTRQVFWSEQGNSYVVVPDAAGFWTAPGAIACDVYSINGHGELRWSITSEQGNTSGDLDAVAYFGLKWHGWRG